MLQQPKISGENMTPEIFFSLSNESELNGLLEGEAPGAVLPWNGRHTLARVPRGAFGVLCKRSNPNDDFFQPIVLVAHEDEFRRLFGRLAQVRSNLSPLTTWCHILTPSRFESLDGLTREAHLGGFEAAWTGLVVAEALLLAERPLSSLKIAACLATQSFAIARTKAMWQAASVKEIIDRYDAAQQVLRTRESRISRLRTAFEPIWASLAAASGGLTNFDYQLAPLVQGLHALHRARRSRNPEEAFEFAAALSAAPEAETLIRLPQLTPEQRVREFDKLMLSLSRATPDEGFVSRHMLAMLASYLATVAAGGAASLSLLEPHALRWPELMAWAYVLGSVGERVVWTSSFDGLGRLVAREMMRPLRLDEAPTCDFSLDEATILFDAQLSDPLVHLRIKQARIATVCLVPGVNILIPLGDQYVSDARGVDGPSQRERSVAEPDQRLSNEAVEKVAEAVWRRLRGRVENYVDSTLRGRQVPRSYEKERSSKRSTQQSKLPLKGPDDK
jgi:hypothetical protein